MTPRILIVDDDAITRKLLSRYLNNDGFSTAELPNGDGIETLLAEQQIDLVVLDINMPGRDGFTLARLLRDEYAVGIILLTSRDDDVDKIVGLELGADDYITKPFNPRELSARVKAVLRRLDPPAQLANPTESPTESPADSPAMFRFDGWQFDLNRHCLIDPQGERCNLTHGEYQLLYTLVHKAGVVQSRDKLATVINPESPENSLRSVDVLIGRLRRKLKEPPKQPNLLVTVHGSGYLFASEAEALE